MQIYKYLNKIKSGELINFDSFCKKLHQHGFDDQAILKAFSTRKHNKTSYHVTVLDGAFFTRLQADFPHYAISDRISAAIAGNSHKHRVSQSIIILWPNKQSHPVVILNDAKEIKSPVNLAKRLLIIENQENFVRKNQTLNFLKHQFPDFTCEDLDIVHGSGNAISNSLNKAFFNKYENIYCLLDLDIGGLTTFANLSVLTAHPRLAFLLPPCASELLEQSKIALKNEHLLELRNFNQKFPLLGPAIQLMFTHKKMLEQEMYLQD